MTMACCQAFGRAWSRALILLAFVAAAPSPAVAQSETVITVAAGTYNLTQIVTQSGTSSNRIRYRAAVPGTVVVRGGARLTGRSFIIIDGFKFVQTLHPNYPSWDETLAIDGSSRDILITNTEVVGPTDLHGGFNANGAVSCQESDGYSAMKPAGVRVASGTSNIVFDNIVVHGFYTAMSFDGTSDVLQNSLIRNNFNGFDVSSNTMTMSNNVFWGHPNHLFEMSGGVGTFNFTNNLVGDALDGIFADTTDQGVTTYNINHNTFWIPENKPCYGMDGLDFRTVLGTAVVRNNVIVSRGNSFMYSMDSADVDKITSNHNLFFVYEAGRFEHFQVSGTDRTFANWKSTSGEDANSLADQRPVFVNAPQYNDSGANQWGFRIPTSPAQARGWLTLQAGSPGKNAASDGTDIGITPGGGGGTPPAAPSSLRLLP